LFLFIVNFTQTQNINKIQNWKNLRENKFAKFSGHMSVC